MSFQDFLATASFYGFWLWVGLLVAEVLYKIYLWCKTR